MSEAVVCKDLKKTYGTGPAAVQALRGVTLSVKKGELLMLVGPSGCGKTTLISIISGILSQDSGECVVYDTHINQLPDAERTSFRGSNVGFVFQAFNLIPTLSAVENTSIPLMLKNIPRDIAIDNATQMLKKVGLEKRLDAFPRQMSGGEQQRVAISRGCIHHPRLIVCDEPTSALDHETGMHVMEVFRSIALSKETAIIVVTHDARIFKYADRILHMDDGRIVNEEHNHKN